MNQTVPLKERRVEEGLTGLGKRKPAKRFNIVYAAVANMEATREFGLTETMSIPRYTKYRNVENDAYKYQNTLYADH